MRPHGGHKEEQKVNEWKIIRLEHAYDLMKTLEAVMDEKEEIMREKE